jgi:hypothetical protein
MAFATASWIAHFFRQKLADRSEGEALYALNELAGRYIETFDDEPVPAAVADRAYERLLKLVASLDPCASADGQLADLNRVAAVDLLAPISNVENSNPPVKRTSRIDTNSCSPLPK